MPAIPAANMTTKEKLPPLEIEDVEDGEQPIVEKAEVSTEVEEGKETEKEVIKEDEEKSDEVSFNDFLKEKGEEGVFGKEKEKKDKDGKVLPVTATIKDGTKVEPDGKVIVERDYSGLTEEQTKLLKKAGNETFAYVKPILIEYGQLKENLTKVNNELTDLKKGKVTYPDSIYEHEQAYVLTPEYSRLNQDKNSAEAILQHWQLQSTLIRKGKDWQDIVIDAKGNMSLSAPKTATDEDEQEVMNNIAFAQRQLAQQEKIHDDFVGSFRARHQTDINAIKQAEATYFKDYDKPDHITAQIQKETLEALPASVRKTALAPMVCKLVGACKLLEFRYNQLAKEKNKSTTIKKLEEKNGPKGEEALGGPAGKETSTISFSAFNAAKE